MELLRLKNAANLKLGEQRPIVLIERIKADAPSPAAVHN